MTKQQKQKIVWWSLAAGAFLAFVVWTILVKTVNVAAAGTDGVVVGLAAMNNWWWGLTATNTVATQLSNWLGYLFLLLVAGLAGWQLVMVLRHRSLRLARHWWALDGVLVALVLVYLLFELVVINGRPLLVNGALKASYPSTHVMLFAVAAFLVAATVWREVKNRPLKITVAILGGILAAVGVSLRAISGVHWLSDIIGGGLLALALDGIYLALTVVSPTIIKTKEQKL